MAFVSTASTPDQSNAAACDACGQTASSVTTALVTATSTSIARGRRCLHMGAASCGTHGCNAISQRLLPRGLGVRAAREARQLEIVL